MGIISKLIFWKAQPVVTGGAAWRSDQQFGIDGAAWLIT